MESARLRLEKRGGVTPDGEDEGRWWLEGVGEGAGERCSDGKWIKFRRMFLFGRDARNRYGSPLKRLFRGTVYLFQWRARVLGQTDEWTDGGVGEQAGRSRSRREMACKIKPPRAPDVDISLQACLLNSCNITA